MKLLRMERTQFQAPPEVSSCPIQCPDLELGKAAVIVKVGVPTVDREGVIQGRETGLKIPFESPATCLFKIHRGPLGLELCGTRVIFPGAGSVASVSLDRPPPKVRFRRVRHFLEHPLDVREGSIEISGGVPQCGPAKKTRGILRMESHRLLRIGRPGFQVSCRKLKTRSAEIGDRRARIELDGLAVLTDGGGSLSLVAKSVSHPQP